MKLRGVNTDLQHTRVVTLCAKAFFWAEGSVFGLNQNTQRVHV